MWCLMKNQYKTLLDDDDSVFTLWARDCIQHYGLSFLSWKKKETERYWLVGDG